MAEAENHKYDYAIDIEAKNDARVVAFDFVEANTKVLDIGSASGCFGQILKAHKNCEVYGIEYDAESIKIAEAKHVFEKIYQLDLNNFDIKQFEQYNGYFDYIVFGDVLEHLLFPDEVLNKFKSLLKPDGKYIISLPNVAHANIKINLLVDKFEYSEIGILDKTHIKFFTHKTIPAFLAKSGLLMEKFDYTVLHTKYETAEKNLSKLPFCVRRYIYKDNYSYPLQYVMLCKPSDKPAEELTKANAIEITRKNTNKELKRVKNSCFRKYVYLYFLTRIGELINKN